MTAHHCLPVLLFLLTACPLASNADEASSRQRGAVETKGQVYELRYQFATGEVLRYQVEHAATVKTTIEGTTQTAHTHTSSTKAWKVIDVLDSGEIEFSHLIERVKMKNELPNRAAVVFDSESDEEPPVGFEQAAAAVGQTLSVIRISPTGKIIRHDVKYAQPGYQEETPMVIPLPSEPITIGATWTEPHEISVKLRDGGRKNIETRRRFELLSVTGDLAIVGITYQVISPITAEIEAQLVQRMSTGKIAFNIKRGRIEKQQLDVDKRIVGFAGPASSMQYRMRFTEQISEPGAAVSQAAGKSAQR